MKGLSVSVMLPHDRQRRKNIFVNTNYCRNEVDTVQYVINKHGYKEVTTASEGHLFWYGLALRDHDIDLIKQKKYFINRYPLMDVSSFLLSTCFSTSPRKTFSVSLYRGCSVSSRLTSGLCLTHSFCRTRLRIWSSICAIFQTRPLSANRLRAARATGSLWYGVSPTSRGMQPITNTLSKGI